jgi:hypothetical protein
MFKNIKDSNGFAFQLPDSKTAKRYKLKSCGFVRTFTATSIIEIHVVIAVQIH